MKPFAPHFPFDPARLPFFYGWVIVAVATLGIIMSIPGQTMGVSVFTDHLINATGLSRLELTYTYMIGTLASSLLLPRAGTLLDRHGSRVTAFSTCLVLAATLCVLSQVDRIANALGDAEQNVATAAVLLTIGFLVLRLSGQGILTMASRTMMTKWFERHRGLASGISGVFVSGGFAIAPLALQGLIDLGDWRGAWFGLAAAVGVGMSSVVWLLYRDNPEECGMQMDGALFVDAGTSDTSTNPKATEEVSYTRGEAIRTVHFWYVTVALSLSAMVYTGITFHIVDLGIETGIGGRAAVRLFLPNAIVSTSVGLISGWASDRISIRPLVVAFLIAQGAGFVGAGRLAEMPFMVMMVVGWGVSGGLFGTLMNVAMPNFFGRTHLGAIASIQMSCMVAGSALGPAFLAAAKTYIGSYRDGLLICCAFSGAALLFALLAPAAPRHPH